ncbi:MAG TPA: hypothetical protein VHX90_03165 [Verrucomicrobiae bacterium]|nr:hypothetical protein [Verrucomicrobiae bacterium]
MNPNWAEENLQTIRTLMERSAVYRRALAPIMILAGTLGLMAAGSGLLFHMDSARQFCGLWLCTAILAIFGSFFIARRQSIKDHESFWSPPTRRVAQALLPPLLVGMCLGVFPAFTENSAGLTFVSTLVWILFYGCALHAAGFFMPRGIKIFGWLFIVSGCGLFYASIADWIDLDNKAHWLMGFFFGVLHLVYGAYLYLTEKKNPVA